MKKKDDAALGAPAEAQAKPGNGEKKSRWRKRVLIGLVVLLAAAGAFYIVWGGPLEVQTETVSPALFEDSFTETGNVRSGLARDHMSPVSGKVAEVLVKKNAAVKTGDVMVRIEAPELAYELQSHRNTLDAYRAQVEEQIRSLRAEISELQAQRSKDAYENATELSPETYLESLRSKLEVAETNLSLREQEMNHARELYEAGAESRVAVEEAEKAYQEAVSESQELKGQYEDAQARLSGRGNSAYYGSLDQSYASRIQTAQGQLNDYLALASAQEPDAPAYEKLSIGKQMAEEQSQIRQLEGKLERCTVRALCDGVVSQLPAENLSDVAEGELVATVRESGDFTLEVNVLTTEEPFLRLGDSVTLTQKLKGQQTVYNGTIREIGSYAEKSLSAIGTEEYRVRVVVDIPESDGLKDGYELEARFTTYRSEDAITVPNGALFKSDGQDCVFVVSGMNAEQRPVEVAHKASIRTELSSGLSAGEQVVVNANLEGLADGSIVSPTE